MSGSSVFDDTSLKLARLFCRIITVIHLIVNQYEIANIYSHYQRISRYKAFIYLFIELMEMNILKHLLSQVTYIFHK